jgi:hypothetical protein
MSRAAMAFAAGIIILAATATLVPARVFAPGWLCAFALLSMIPIGSLAMLLVHGISGGRWGGDLAAVLAPAARAIPLFLLAFIPILLLRPLLYQWPAHGVPADVARYYFNPPFFALRTIVALTIWSFLAWREVWKSQLWSGVALVIHGILITFIPADWILSLRPGSSSAGFGLGFGVEQMFAALAFAALLAPQGDNPRANRDLAGMIVTTLLGTVYFFYMAFIVTWYGNIPDKVDWYVARTYGVWPLVVFASFVLGAAIPFLAILNPWVRRSPMPMRLLGALVLTGIALHIAWLTMPAFGYGPIIPALLSVLTIALFAASARQRLVPARRRRGH